MALTTSDLLTNIKRRAQLPDDSGTLSDSDILAMASDELQNVVFPRLMAMSEWHGVFSYTITLSSSRSYRVHPRAAANGVIGLEYLDGSNYRTLPKKHPLMQKPNDAECWTVLGNTIVLSDSVATSGTIRVRAFLRPSRLVASGCTAISAYDTSTEILTVGSSSGFTANQFVDIVYADSPYEVFLAGGAYDGGSVGRVSSIPDGTHVDMVDDIDSTWPGASAITTGARLCPAEQTDRVPLMDELHDYLAQRTAIRCMEARGFTQDMENHMKKLADLELSFDRLVRPRNKGEFKAIVSEDWYSFGAY